ncbi:hypothetical protein BGX26_001024, partial [Mortierella sp. AD094]
PNAPMDGPSANPELHCLTSRHLAYIIYTSGSTGKPKGVMVEHAQVTRLFNSSDVWCNFEKSDIWMMIHSYGFDFSVWELWGPLHSGVRSPEDLYHFMCEQAVTVLNMTPSAFKPFIRVQEQRNLLDQLRIVVLAGEALEPAILKPWYATRPEKMPLVVNMYGPTETTVYALYRVMMLQDCDHHMSPIGVRVPDLTTYVLDTHGRPVPLGVVGELCIGGAGVTRGYMNCPELTSERFPLDPFSKVNEAKMYKTGDLVRYLPDGELLYLGRNDHQVKIRGFRIELGEIEARLMDHILVRESAVVAHGEGIDKRLVAYVVAESANGLPHTLRAHLVEKLPEYMVPSAFIQLDAFPLTPNGKRDIRALPKPDGNAIASQEYEAPQGEIECTLATIWAELLKVDRVGRRDNFFVLGGHSLLAVRLIKLVNSRLGYNLRLHELFETPTIAELTAQILGDHHRQDHSLDVLLPLKPQGNRIPLFCVHPALGLSWSFIGLTKHLHPEQPLYGLQSRGVEGNGELAATMEDVASDYIRHIRRVQPHGPYHLLGWSFGGCVAHIMAVQLQELGEEVGLLALMDSPADFSHVPESVDADSEKEIYAHYQAWVRDENAIEGSETLWEKAQHTLRNNMKLVKQFSPSVYSGDIVFFNASSPINPSSWAPFSLGGIEIHEVECKHQYMDQPESLAVIGQVLATKLEESHQRWILNL